MWDIFTTKHNFIAPFAWELEFTTATGFSLDQLRLAIAAFLAVFIAPGIRLFSSPALRNLYSIISGFLVVYYPFGSGVFHIFPPAFLTFCTLHLIPRKAGTLAWLICFPYLIAMHVANASGESWQKGELDFTGGLMVLVLKLIAVSVCLQDYYDKKPEEMSGYQQAHHISSPPGLLEYLGYVLCMGSLLSGPFCEFKDYQQWINRQGVFAKRYPLGLRHTMKLFVGAVLCLAAYAVMEMYFTIDNLMGPYRHWPVMARLTFMIFIAQTLRVKYYFIWQLAEASLTLAGLNLAGWEEDGKRVKWGRCNNADMYNVELQPSARVLPQYWNKQTGNFLRHYVYERLTPKDAQGRPKPSFWTLNMTQLVSAVWHGLFPGYPLFFVSGAVLFHTSTVIYKIEQNKFPGWLKKNFLWHCLKVYVTAVGLDYSAMAFICLGFWNTLEVWASVHYIPHIYFLLLMLLGRTSLARAPRVAKAEGSKAGGSVKVAAANGAVTEFEVKDGDIKKVQ